MATNIGPGQQISHPPKCFTLTGRTIFLRMLDLYTLVGWAHPGCCMGRFKRWRKLTIHSFLSFAEISSTYQDTSHIAPLIAEGSKDYGDACQVGKGVLEYSIESIVI